MNKLILFAIVLAVLSAVLFFALQKPKQEQTYQKNTGLRYVALGDSYTIGEGVNENQRWPNMLISRLKASDVQLNIVANPSRTGYTTEDLLDKEISILKNSNAQFVTLQIGVNDYYQGSSAPEFANNFNRVLDAVQQSAPSAKLLVVTIPDYSKTPFASNNNPTISSGIEEFNQIIKTESAKRNIPVADIFAISQTSTTAGKIVKDGLHPSEEQYKDWLSVIYPEAEKLLRN